MARPAFIDLVTGSVDTSGATLTTLIEYQIPSSSVPYEDFTISCTVIVSGKDSSNDLGGGFFHFAVFKYNSGTDILSKINSDRIHEFEEEPDWNIEINATGGNAIVVQVQGAVGADVSWGGELKLVYGTAS